MWGGKNSFPTFNSLQNCTTWYPCKWSRCDHPTRQLRKQGCDSEVQGAAQGHTVAQSQIAPRCPALSFLTLLLQHFGSITSAASRFWTHSVFGLSCICFRTANSTISVAGRLMDTKAAHAWGGCCYTARVLPTLTWKKCMKRVIWKWKVESAGKNILLQP